MFSHLFNATKRIDIKVASEIEADSISAIDLICGHTILVQYAAIGHRVHGDAPAQAGVHGAAAVVVTVAAGAAAV